MSWTEIIKKPLFQNTFILKGSRIAKVADFFKIPTKFIKTVFKNSNKNKKTRNYVLKCDLYLYFFI